LKQILSFLYMGFEDIHYSRPRKYGADVAPVPTDMA
jgi:hypothetical protein